MHRVNLLSITSITIMGFDKLKEDYTSLPNFGEAYLTLSNNVNVSLNNYSNQDRLLFKAYLTLIFLFGKFTLVAFQDISNWIKPLKKGNANFIGRVSNIM